MAVKGRTWPGAVEEVQRIRIAGREGLEGGGLGRVERSIGGPKIPGGGPPGPGMTPGGGPAPRGMPGGAPPWANGGGPLALAPGGGPVLEGVAILGELEALAGWGEVGAGFDKTLPIVLLMVSE